MITIDYKSTGTLLNEFITANLKYKYIGAKPAFAQRIEDIRDALSRRHMYIIDASPQFQLVKAEYDKLEVVLNDLWWAVEETIKLRNANKDDYDLIKAAGYAALKAFELNATRCDLIRDMDAKLGESGVTFLEKSY